MTNDLKEQKFWAWFKENEETIFNFEHDQERALNRLHAALINVSPDLTFEIGPVVNGARDLVISAGGIKSAFPAVEALTDAAPAMRRWKVIGFRPRRSPIMEVNLAGRTVKPEEVEFCLLSNGRELGIYLFFDAYSEEERHVWGEIGYLLLDEALGEYDVETKLGPIGFFHASAHPDAERFTLPELPELFDEHFAALKRTH